MLAVLLLSLMIRGGVAAPGPGVCDANAPPADLNFTLKDMTGRDVMLASFTGKVVLLNFWATWCGPCRVEIPGFVELYAKYRSRGLVVLGVSVDDPVSKLRPFAAQMKMNYPVLVGNGHADLQKAFPLVGVPNTFVIARDGTLCTKFGGLTLGEQLEPLINVLLSRK